MISENKRQALIGILRDFVCSKNYNLCYHYHPTDRITDFCFGKDKETFEEITIIWNEASNIYDTFDAIKNYIEDRFDRVNANRPVGIQRSVNMGKNSYICGRCTFNKVSGCSHRCLTCDGTNNFIEKSPQSKVDYTRLYRTFALGEFNSGDKLSIDLRNIIENVIFNPPATIVFWTDGTKTVVKAQDEYFDPWTGLAMAISKRALGNQGNYFEVFKKWCEPYEEKQKNKKPTIEEIIEYVKNFGEAFGCGVDDAFGCDIDGEKRVGNYVFTADADGTKFKYEPVDDSIATTNAKVDGDKSQTTWKIWSRLYFPDADFTRIYEHPYEYKHKSSAVRAAKRRYEGTMYEWVVAQENPWPDEVVDAE